MKLVILNARLGLWPDLFVPRPYKESDPRYVARFVIDPGSENDDNVLDTIDAVAEETLGTRWQKIIKPYMTQKTMCCYLDGAILGNDVYEGKKVLTATRQEIKGPPKVVGRSRNDVKLKDGIFYPGCTVNGIVDIWVQQGENPGIRCAFNTIQFVQDSEAFTNEAKPDTEGLPDLADDIDDDNKFL